MRFEPGSAYTTAVYDRACLEWALTMPEPAPIPSDADMFVDASGAPLRCISNRVLMRMRREAVETNTKHAKALAAAVAHARKTNHESTQRLLALQERWSAWAK